MNMNCDYRLVAVSKKVGYFFRGVMRGVALSIQQCPSPAALGVVGPTRVAGLSK